MSLYILTDSCYPINQKERLDMLIQNGDVVLFQGDSITDAGRIYENPNDLGPGYPNFIASMFSALHPDLEVNFVNRGISGNRVRDLKARWIKDCLDIKPDVLSILIGINDTWRRFDSGDPTTAEAFKADYQDILSQVRTELPKTKIILLEPFVLPYPADRIAWREDLDPKIHAVRELAKEFDTYFLPLDGVFAQAYLRKEPTFWSADGVHPTQAGHALITKEWLGLISSSFEK